MLRQRIRYSVREMRRGVQSLEINSEGVIHAGKPFVGFPRDMLTAQIKSQPLVNAGVYDGRSGVTLTVDPT